MVVWSSICRAVGKVNPISIVSKPSGTLPAILKNGKNSVKKFFPFHTNFFDLLLCNHYVQTSVWTHKVNNNNKKKTQLI